MFKKLFKWKKNDTDDQKLKEQIMNDEMDQDELEGVKGGLEVDEITDWCSGSIYCHLFSQDPDR